MAGFGASDVLVRGQSRRGLAFIIALAVPGSAALLCELTDNPMYGDYVALVGVAEAIAFFFLPAVAPNGVGLVSGERRGPLRANCEGITFRGRTLISRAQIRHSAIEGLPGGMQVVHLSARRAKHDVHIEVEDDMKARALVAALELDPDQHVATFSVHEDPLRSRLRWFAARVLIAAGGIAVSGTVLHFARRHELLLLALVPVVLVYALFLPRTRIRTDVVLGADGLTLRHRGKQRSIPLSTISEVRSAPNTATLVLEGNEELLLRFGADDDAKTAIVHGAFISRMRQTLVRRDRPRDPGEALLTRGERDVADWVRHLISLGGAGEGYRVATIPDETLWRIAEGAVAEPTARVGALVALRARFDDDARARLHHLASRTAQPELRAALDAAGDGAEAEAIIAAYERGSGN